MALGEVCELEEECLLPEMGSWGLLVWHLCAGF